MNVKDVLGKVGGVIGKLPFVKLAEKIPEGARTKLPFLNALIPLANHIASGAAIVVLISCLGGGGGGGLAGTKWQSEIGQHTFTFGNNTFSLHSITGSFSGTYEIHGDTIMLLFNDGSSGTSTINGNTMDLDTVDFDYIKQ